jgi:hypothetical protein
MRPVHVECLMGQAYYSHARKPLWRDWRVAASQETCVDRADRQKRDAARKIDSEEHFWRPHRVVV